MKDIQINVIGRPMVGKSTVIKIIEEALENKGFLVEVNDVDYNSSGKFIEQKTKTVADKSKITINQVMANREGIVNV